MFFMKFINQINSVTDFENIKTIPAKSMIFNNSSENINVNNSTNTSVPSDIVVNFTDLFMHLNQ